MIMSVQGYFVLPTTIVVGINLPTVGEGFVCPTTCIDSGNQVFRLTFANSLR